VAINQSSEKGTDAMFWGARRQSATTSATLFADFHQQRLVDADEDGWGEFPRAIRFSIRPTVFLDRPNGDGLLATAGVMSEDRTGGYLLNPVGQSAYREEQRMAHADLGVTAVKVVGRTGRLTARLGSAFQGTNHRFDVALERDTRWTLSGELSYAASAGPVAWTAGVAYQRDELRERDYPDFNYTYSVPAVFAQIAVTPAGRISGSVTGRCDQHNVYGLFCTPRVSVLFKPNASLRARVGASGGFYAPTPLTEEVEAVGLHLAVPAVVNSERLQTAEAEIEWTRGNWEVTGSVSASRITRPVRLIPFEGDPLLRFRLRNMTEPTRIFSGELQAVYHADPIVATAFYAYQHGTEENPDGSGRRETDLTPRHSAGLDLAWRAPIRGTWVNLETTYTGRQFVWDNPYRTETPGYATINLLVSQRTGRARLYVSGENLTDMKLADYQPLVLVDPAAGGRRTTAPWAPLRGRVISLGALFDW
jgi:iron complex outermembrane receptor protein